MAASSKVTWDEVLLVTLVPAILSLIMEGYLVCTVVPLRLWLREPLESYYKVSVAIASYGPVAWSVMHVVFTYLAVKLMRSEGESVRDYLRVPGGWRGIALDALTALLLLALNYVFFNVLFPWVLTLTMPAGFLDAFLRAVRDVPTHFKVYALTVTCFTAGLCEELIWRAYGITRMERLLGGRTNLAVLVSAVLFGFWHGLSVYGLLCFLVGLAYGFVFARIRRITPLFVAHWVGDVVAFRALYFAS